MLSRLVAITVLAVLALPAGALAKEPVKATVCGADGCVTSKERAAILPLVEGGPPVAAPPRAGAPAYRLRLTLATGAGRTDSFTNWMSPKLRLIRGSEGTWMTLPAATRAALLRVAGDLRPFPAERMPIGGRTAGRGESLPPETYAPAPHRAPEAATSTHWTFMGAIGAAAIGVLAAALAVARRRRAHAGPRPAVS
jgi:hypothetical protein